jgi:membrane protease YdiL (CAAX protease family)
VSVTGLNRSKHYPTIAQAVLLLGAVLSLNILLDLALRSVWGLAGGQGIKIRFYDDHPLLQYLLLSLAVSFVAWTGWQRSRVPWRQVFPFRAVPAAKIAAAVLIAVGLHFLLSDLDNLLRPALGYRMDPALQEALSGNLWEVAFFVVILAPLTEEVLFRGLILTGFANNYSLKTAILASAALFGAFHLNLAQFFPAVVIGAVLGWLVLFTRSLWVGVIGHAVNNAMPLLMSRVLQVRIPGYTVESVAGATFQPWWFNLIGVALVAAGIRLLAGSGGEEREASVPAELQRPELAPLPPPLESKPAKDSNYGRFSLGLAVLVGVGFVTLSVWVASARENGRLETLQPVVGLLTIVQFLLGFAGFGLGLSGLRHDSNKKAAGIGVALNGFYILLMLAGFAATLG